MTGPQPTPPSCEEGAVPSPRHPPGSSPLSEDIFELWLGRGEADPGRFGARRGEALQKLSEAYGMTPRQRTIVAMTIEGGTRKTICRELGIGVSTYDTHARDLRQRTGLHVSRVALLVLRHAAALP